jgi:hypothetical protein
MEMTNAERMINHIQLRLAQKQYTVLNWELTMFDKMLKTLPGYDVDKAYDIICADDEAPEIEDSAMYRTFDSSEFHVGDEIVDANGGRAVIYMMSCEGAFALYGNKTEYFSLNNPNFNRTGRNFPAIENILKIIAKESKE